jgi:hypothetical protein
MKPANDSEDVVIDLESMRLMLIHRDTLPSHIYCALYNDSLDAIKQRIKRGQWKHGEQVSKPAGSKILWILLEGVDAWAIGKNGNSLKASS